MKCLKTHSLFRIQLLPSHHYNTRLCVLPPALKPFLFGIPLLTLANGGSVTCLAQAAQAPPTEKTTAIPPSTPQPPSPETSGKKGSTGDVSGGPDAGVPAPTDDTGKPLQPPSRPALKYSFESFSQDIFGNISASKRVEITYAGITITSDRLEGNLNRELIFTGNAKIAANGATSYADVIHFYPRERRYRLDNPRGIISPELLQGRVYDPVFFTGGELFGDRAGYTNADDFVVTTCIEPFHHYDLRIRNAELFPQKRLVLRRVGVFFFGVKLITLPTIVIPLDRRRPRRPQADYLPEIGQNVDEGYYARFPYTFAEGGDAATFLRTDITQKRGIGYRVEQEYLAGKQGSAFDTSGYGNYSGGAGIIPGGGGAFTTAYGYGSTGARLPRLGTGIGPQSGGLITAQGYLKDGFDRNFNASARHQQSIGGSNRFDVSTEFRRNSFLVSSGATAQTSRFDFFHSDATHGVNGELSLNYMTNSQDAAPTSSAFSSSQLTGALRQTFEFATRGSNRNSLGLNLNLSRLINTSSTLATATTPAVDNSTRSARIDSDLQFQHYSREYSYTLSANKSTPFGKQTGGSSFGTLEKLPEFQFTADTNNFRGGFLRKIPTNFLVDIGRFNEPSSHINTERYLVGATVQQFSLLRGRTELVTGGGFEQRMYGDGAAQYDVRNNTRLRQHLAGRSGIDFDYRYEQPEGGTPFAFDTYGRANFLSAEGGYLDDTHFQATARVGYDLLGTSHLAPWQSLSTRLMWRPNNNLRFDSLATYDPNRARFFAFTNQMQLRGANDFGFDLVTRIDPQQKGIRRKFSQINTQFNLPFGPRWRVTGLLRYSGNSGQFESRSLQLTHRWDCIEANFTYVENTSSYRPDRQFQFSIRILALPFSRNANRGASGQTLGVGVGDVY